MANLEIDPQSILKMPVRIDPTLRPNEWYMISSELDDLKKLQIYLTEALKYVEELLASRQACRVCSKEIKMISWKGTGYCSIICEKISKGEITIERAVELGVIKKL